ncbi:acyl-CoA N-acyltransferase [Podospora conica]|nr:acyl-CoA N-acyltransferase [Schizothecium conicum]
MFDRRLVPPLLRSSGVQVVLLVVLLQFTPTLFHMYLSKFTSRPDMQNQHRVTRPITMTLRSATLRDLDAITNLGLASLHDDPVWPYRFPWARIYPKVHYKYSRIRFEEYLESVDMGLIQCMVIEIPDEDDPSASKIIAFSMWSLPKSWRPTDGTEPGIKRPSDHPERRDASAARMLEFRKELAMAKKLYFDPEFGDEQLNLMILATHPDYRRRGAATALLHWGMEEAEIKGVGVTLFSSPMGLPLYRKNGFEQVGMVHVQVDGEKEYIKLPAMVWRPP